MRPSPDRGGEGQTGSGFLVDLFGTSNPLEEADDLTARDLLRRGKKGLAALEDQSAVRAQMLDAMGRAHVGLNNYEYERATRHFAAPSRCGAGSPVGPDSAGVRTPIRHPQYGHL